MTDDSALLRGDCGHARDRRWVAVYPALCIALAMVLLGCSSENTQKSEPLTTAGLYSGPNGAPTAGDLNAARAKLVAAAATFDGYRGEKNWSYARKALQDLDQAEFGSPEQILQDTQRDKKNRASLRAYKAQLQELSDRQNARWVVFLNEAIDAGTVLPLPDYLSHVIAYQHGRYVQLPPTPSKGPDGTDPKGERALWDVTHPERTP